MSSSSSICQICNHAPYKYCCPKCNILYCSINCYKSTSHLQCSEQFYRRCVEDELASNTSNFGSHAMMDEGIRRMHEILQRVNEQDPSQYDFDMEEPNLEYMYGDCLPNLDSDDEDDEDLVKRLEGVNFDDPDEIWKRLTSEERYEFETLLQTGEITKLIPTCQVWWEIQENPKLIEEITTNEQNDKNNGELTGAVGCTYPEILGDIQPFSTITQKPPSSCIINNITNVLAAYAYMVRFFNGEHRQTPQEAVNCLYTLSATLKNNANFDNEDQSIISVIYEGQSEGLSLGDKEHTILCEDVRKMFEGRIKGKSEKLYILAALSDIHRLLTVAKLTKSLKSKTTKLNDVNSKNGDDDTVETSDCDGASAIVDDGNNYFTQKKYLKHRKATLFHELDRRKLNLLIKKIEYFLSYIDNKTN